MPRIAIVTGANRGIGQEIARELAARGLHVVPTSRAPQKGYATLDVEDRGRSKRSPAPKRNPASTSSSTTPALRSAASTLPSPLERSP